MCPNCYAEQGTGIGWGIGQLYRGQRRSDQWVCIAGGALEVEESDWYLKIAQKLGGGGLTGPNAPVPLPDFLIAGGNAGGRPRDVVVVDPSSPEGKSGLNQSELDLLAELFGDGRATTPPTTSQSSSPGSLFDETPYPERVYLDNVDPSRYDKSLPFFNEAVKELGKPGDDVRPVIAKLVKELEADGFTKERLADMRPYLLQYISDVKTGVVRFDET